MIEVVDRVPTYPGRVKLIPVSGQANTYDMVRADEPIEEGTPINRALFQALMDEMNAIRQQVEDKLFEISNRVRIGELADGTVFGLRENGVLVPFIKLANDFSSVGPVLAVRKSCVAADVLMDEDEVYYGDCRTDIWLNNEYISMLDTAIQSVLSTVKISIDTASSATNINRKVFLLSLAEYQIYGGNEVTYFTTPASRIATLNGTPVNHWTRNVGPYSSSTWSYVTVNGNQGDAEPQTFVAGIRPAFTLPADFEVAVGVPDT